MRSAPVETKRAAGTLVSADWLEEHMNDAGVSVVEIDVSATAYDDGHIPGAVLWNIYTDLKDDAYQPVPMSEIETLVRDSGITEDDVVVFYGYAPALGFWLMKLCGHVDVRILDTDRTTWQYEGRPWDDRVPTPQPTTYQIDESLYAIRATLPFVEDSIDDEGNTILDVRSKLEYVGERFWPSGGVPEGGRAGRIPSSTHLPADGIVAPDGSFRSSEELREIFSGVDLSGAKQLITYCTVGARAATVWFALTSILGYENVRVYDGSWAQWGMTTDVPIELA